jgi:hypothetical protein
MQHIQPSLQSEFICREGIFVKANPLQGANATNFS